MKKTRIIARLDVKNEFVIKGINLEGLRKIGNPNEIAKKYYDEGIDEIIFMDAVASLYDRNNLFGIIEKACKDIFVPITIGGGIRTINDIDLALKAGADKVALNTQAIKNPKIIKEASRIYGSQSLICSIEAKKKGPIWEAYVDNGRQETGVNVIEWVKQVEDLGVGEIMITSVDQEGTKKGFEIDLMQNIMQATNIPIIASGGAGSPDHIIRIINKAKVDAVAIASILHYNINTISDIKSLISNSNIPIRQ